MKAWIGKHNGLPCFYSATPVRVEAPDGRILDTGDGKYTLVADVLATPGARGSYRVGGQKHSLAPSDVGHMLVSTQSGKSARVQWFGDDGQTSDLAVRVGAATRWLAGEASTRGVLHARTHGAKATAALASVLRERAPLVAVHSAAHCRVPGCDIPPARLITVSEMTHARTNRVDVPVREWELPYETLPLGNFQGAVPVLTWCDWQAQSARWQPKTVEALLREIAGMP